jgi:hypothetical protein
LQAYEAEGALLDFRAQGWRVLVSVRFFGPRADKRRLVNTRGDCQRKIGTSARANPGEE